MKLTTRQQKVLARTCAAFAASVAGVDHSVLRALERKGLVVRLHADGANPQLWMPTISGEAENAHQQNRR